MQAGALFYFMFADGTELSLLPPLQLSPADLRRLHRYTACVALRHQGCIGLLESTASSPRQLPAPSVLPTGRLPRRGKALATGANPLGASLSTHPPLRDQAAPK